mmetsp:Transcript_16021/g.23440  ORF Transcript_16021/g.23440 Transcript_16021/m.23440 type:complete len:212 (+) Transcript_16021:196-831(+)
MVGYAMIANDIIPRVGNAHIIDVPLTHLLKKLDLIILVLRPAHVKDNWRDFLLHNLHHKFLILLVKMPPTGEFDHISAQHLDSQPEQRRVFIHQLNQGLLVAMRSKDLISSVQKACKQVLRSWIIPHVVKSGIGTERGVAGAVRPIVLEVHIKVLVWIIGVVEILEGICVPYDIDVLKEEVVAEVIDELHTDHLREHHSHEGTITVMFCLG